MTKADIAKEVNDFLKQYSYGWLFKCRVCGAYFCVSKPYLIGDSDEKRVHRCKLDEQLEKPNAVFGMADFVGKVERQE